MGWRRTQLLDQEPNAPATWMYVVDTAAEISGFTGIPAGSMAVALDNSAFYLANASGNFAQPGGAPSGGGKAIDHFRQVGTTPLERWYVAGAANATPMTTGAPAINRIHAMPFVSGRGGTLDRIAVNVTTVAATGKLRVGIYNSTSATNLYPSSLVVGSAEMLSSTTGMKAHTMIQALTADTLYWLAYVAGTAAVTIRCLALAGAAPLLGADLLLAITPGVGLDVAFTYAGLPATFPAGAVAKIAVPIPAIGVRYSA